MIKISTGKRIESKNGTKRSVEPGIDEKGTHPKKRSKHSLSELTKKLVCLMNDNIKMKKQNKIDIRQMATLLGIPKRRIYDITSVLCDIGVATKCEKNVLSWKGVPEGQNANKRTLTSRTRFYNEELDKMIEKTDKEIEQIEKSEDYDKYCFLSSKEITTRCGKNLIVITPCKEEDIEVTRYRRGKAYNLRVRIKKSTDVTVYVL